MSRPAQKASMQDLRRELAECALVVGEPRIYADLFNLGVTGRGVTGDSPETSLHFEAILASAPGQFRFARDQDDQGGAYAAVVFGVHDELGALADLAAWAIGAPDVRLRRGAVAVLGLECLSAPGAREPLHVFATPLAWMRAGRRGLLILAAEPVAHLPARLAPHCRRWRPPYEGRDRTPCRSAAATRRAPQ